MAQNIRQAEGILRVTPSPGHSPTLPKEGQENILITSALPYCNNVPHLGNIIGSTLSADVFSRYTRTRNKNTLYICGTDEYGTATENAAEAEGVTPQELCDKYHALHREVYDWFEIGFDKFGRTSTPLHTEICQEIYRNLRNNGFLKIQSTEQAYCVGCSKFLADRLIEGTCPYCGYEDARGDQCDGCSRTIEDAIQLINPRCKTNKTHKVITREALQNYIQLNKIQPRTEAWLKKAAIEGKWPNNGLINSEGEIIDKRLKDGLQPTAITRDLLWGVPVPIETKEEEVLKGRVLYVWFDAPIGYASITSNYTPEWKQWWFNPKNVRLYQFMGKDNTYFHGVSFPSAQIGDGRDWTTVHHISSTAYLNYEGGKFSKSRNRGVFGPSARETGIPPSVWRYYLISTRPETTDAMFSWADCIAANNNVLLNNFGNFVNRALKFLATQYDGVVPEGDAPGELSPNDEHDAAFISDVNALLDEYIDTMDAVKLRRGLQIVMLISARGNAYLQSSGLSKALLTENPARCAQVLSRAINLIYILSALVYPFMPSTSEAILKQLNAPARAVPHVLTTDILAGHTIGKLEHLFKRIEESEAEKFRKRYGEVEGVAEVHPKAKPKKGKVAPVYDGPKTPEMEALEAKIAEQGVSVRSLKGQTPKTPELEVQIKEAVESLKQLKNDLTALQQI